MQLAEAEARVAAGTAAEAGELGEAGLEHHTAHSLPADLRRACFGLLELNMRQLYADEWDPHEKRADLRAPEARFVLAVGPDRGLDGFAHYRYVIEPEEYSSRGIPVLYVYEIQVAARAQGQGLGRRLMELLERLAESSRMSGVPLPRRPVEWLQVALTCFKHNLPALRFYERLGYSRAANSPPHRLDPEPANFEILNKLWEPGAAAMLEACCAPGDQSDSNTVDTLRNEPTIE